MSEPFGPWDGALQRHVTPQRQRVARGTGEAQPRIARLPPWAGRAPDWRAEPPLAEPGRPERLAPSRPEGVELGPVPASASPLAARDGGDNRFLRGSLIHALLQHLPDLPAASRSAAAVAWLDRPGHGLGRRRSRNTGCRDTGDPRLIRNWPRCSAADSRAEVPLTGVVGGQVVGGLVDRLAVLPDRVLMVDYKTNRRPPVRLEDTPVLYLRQMAAYRAVLRRHLPRVVTVHLRAGLDPDVASRHAAGRAAGGSCATDRGRRSVQPCARCGLMCLPWFPRHRATVRLRLR